MNEPVTQHSLNTDLVSLHDESASLYVKYTGNCTPFTLKKIIYVA